ncbi:type II secretion system F family protein [Microbacterium sp. ET2]|uniref:type II secretion system F family protein n=1 Tax=Microbacterium albipurpureum TaxID=3050384 RepID=UPI00259CECE2|nr:type II secretion system F family protein [Microbacterium sp. ET2 (Ac-2212)]WJL95891.1 type II secretion system F family protein [Microbacterium sp. ET2 (Ac-2212)]
MTLLWGGVLAAGILLALSPWLWPATDEKRPASTAEGGRTTQLLREAGFARGTPLALAVVAVLLAVVVAASAFLVTTVLPLALAAFAGTAIAPYWWVRARRDRLRKTRRSLWPDVCDLLVASVRAGMSLPDAVASLAESAPLALRPNFRGFARDLAASGHFDSAMLALKDSLADPVADRVIETLRMARQVGGTELTTVLRALSASVRSDAAIRAEVDARQSWIRGAAVLGAAAPWVILSLLALRPEGAAAYATAEGMILIVGGAVVSVIAFRIMLRIGRLPEARRWAR